MRNDRAILIIMAITYFMITFAGGAVILTIPAVGAEFHSSAITLGWVVAGYILSSAAFSLPFGRFSDIIGRRKIYMVGVFLFALCSFLSAISWSIEVLIILRIVHGVAAAMIFSTSMAIVVSSVNPEKRGAALGMTSAATYIGSTSGPVLGGIINHYFGWRAILYIIALLGAGIFVAALIIVKEKGENKVKEKMDLVGSLIYIVFISFILFGLSAYTSESYAKYILLMGIIMLSLFIFYENREKVPMINLSIFKSNMAFSMSNLAALINYFATFGIGYMLSVFLQVVMKYDSQQAGMVLLFQPITMALFSPIAGKLSDRIEARIIASFGLGIITVGLVVLSFINKNVSIIAIIVIQIFIGMGFALFTSPNTNAIMGSVEKKYYGIASSLIATMRLIGQALSMAVITLLVSLIVGNSTLASAGEIKLIEVMKISFWVFAVFCFIGIFISMTRGKILKNKGDIG